MLPAPLSGTENSLSIDPKGVEALRQSARQNSPQALKTAAQQFEGLFMSMIMKSMRDATPKEGPMDSEQGKMFTSMLDQQLSQNLAKRGVGLADVLIRQLSKAAGVAPAGAGDTGKGAGPDGSAALNPAQLGMLGAGNLALGPDAKSRFQGTLQEAMESGIPGVLKAALTGLQNSTFAGKALDMPTARSDAVSRPGQAPHVRAFEEKLAAHAEEAARGTGIPAKFMLGQAALESGWGKREILTADGNSSHNIFGVKAGTGWKGKVVETATTEYVNGVPERRIERFKAYDSYGDAFRDYAKTLTSNPRYQAVLANAQNLKGFAQGLQRAGYATDPHYAAKLTRIITHSLSA